MVHGQRDDSCLPGSSEDLSDYDDNEPVKRPEAAAEYNQYDEAEASPMDVDDPEMFADEACLSAPSPSPSP